MARILDLSTTPIADGVTVVEASAGTGKTYCLAGLVLRMLLEGKVRDVSSVLVVTFTRAATHELTTRLRAALRLAHRLMRGETTSDDRFFNDLAARFGGRGGADVLRRALLQFDDLGVFTIHGFCKRVLEESAFESGVDFRPEFLDDDAPVLRRAARDFWRRRLYPASDRVAAVVAQEGWTPETFLADYRVWRRHPRTRILPEAAGLEPAIAGLRAACDDLGRVWRRSALRTFLASLRYLKSSKIDPERLEPLLDDLEAFHAGEPARGLWAIALLSGERLRKSVRKAFHETVEQHPYVRGCDRVRAAVEDFGHSLRAAFVTEVDELFDRAKRASGALSFDDLLRRVRSALRDPRRASHLIASVRGRYQAALVDEFQDTDLVQYEIFSRLFEVASRPGPLYLIGDPKQAIYRFRGADVFAYMAAKSGADRRLTLDRNWRSDERLLAAVNALFGRAARPFVFPEIPFESLAAAELAGRERLVGAGRAPLRWLWLDRQSSKEQAVRRIGRAVAGEVVRLLDGGARFEGPGGERPLAPGDVAVLVRTNDQAQALREALEAVRVPSVVSRSGDVFESDEMAELLRLLRAIADPGWPAAGSASRARAAWSTRIWGADAATLLRLRGDAGARRERLEQLEDYRRQWRRQGFMAMAQRILQERGVRRRFLAEESGERRLTNLLHAIELLHRAILERHLSPAGLLAWLADERARRAAGSGSRSGSSSPGGPDRLHDGNATELRLETDAQAVQIATIHKSKGLEYGVVFCPFLWEARPQDRPPVTAHLDPRRVVYDFGSKNFPRHRDQAEAERLAEDLRLAYVAMTRARHRCYLVWGEVGRSSAASALGYLLRAREEEASEPGGGRAAPAQAARGQLGLEALFARPEPKPAGVYVREALEQVRRETPGWRAMLQDFVDRHGDLMALRAVAEEDVEVPWTGASASGRALRAAELPDLGERLVPWQRVSFSSLSQGWDAELADGLDPGLPAPRAAPCEAAGMFGFARGTRAGTCLHEILERCDLRAAASPETRQLIDEVLRRHGLAEADRHPAGAGAFDPAAAVAGMLCRLAATPLPAAGLPAPGFALASVAPERRLVEWRFSTPQGGIAPESFARAFRDAGEGRVRDGYAARVEGLSHATAGGFLTGIVDLLFEHEGRWWVLDWKSNHLGDAVEDYGPEGLWEAMGHHHYVLQYHLYVLAVQRYLRSRLPDYDYQRHFGGVIYVFLRGVAEAASGDAGWYVDRPPRRLIEELEATLVGSA